MAAKHQQCALNDCNVPRGRWIRDSRDGYKVSGLSETAQAALIELNDRTHDVQGFLAAAYVHKSCRKSIIALREAKMKAPRTSTSSSSSSSSMPALEAALGTVLPRCCSHCGQDPRAEITDDSLRAARLALRHSRADREEDRELSDDEDRRETPQIRVRLLWRFVLFSRIVSSEGLECLMEKVSLIFRISSSQTRYISMLGPISNSPDPNYEQPASASAAGPRVVQTRSAMPLALFMRASRLRLRLRRRQLQLSLNRLQPPSCRRVA